MQVRVPSMAWKESAWKQMKEKIQENPFRYVSRWHGISIPDIRLGMERPRGCYRPLSLVRV